MVLSVVVQNVFGSVYAFGAAQRRICMALVIICVCVTAATSVPLN